MCAREPQPEKESLLAVTKGWKYLLSGQTECKILLKLKRSTKITEQQKDRRPVIIKPGQSWPGDDLPVIFRAISEQTTIILTRIILLKFKLKGNILDW